MKEVTVFDNRVSIAGTVCWQNLEQFAREQVQHFIQHLLEEEVAALLGRQKSQRREAGNPAAAPPEGAEEPPPAPVYRNGYGKPRQLATPSGTLTLRRPRVRGLAERFESRILPLFKRRTEAVGKLLPELYLHGLSTGDFDLALRGLLGEGAPLSPSSIQRLKAGWQQEYEAWKSRPLEDGQVVYLWVDGIYVKAGLEKEKAALLVIIGALADGRKVVLAVEAGHRESTESWSSILRKLKERGMSCPRLVIGDGNLGIWGALANVFPAAGEQRCWNHRVVNVLDRIGKKQQPAAKVWLRQVMYAETREHATELKGKFQRWCARMSCRDAGLLLDNDWDRMVTYYDFPEAHWKHLRTTNPVESPFAAVRLRTTAAKRYKKVENATAVIWKTLLIAEQRFRKVDAPELMPLVAAGIGYRNGKRTRCLPEMMRELHGEQELREVAA
jgi:transposase-like protein